MPEKCRTLFVRSFAALFVLLFVTSLALAANPAENEENERQEDVAGREQWFMRGRTYEGKPASQLLNRAQQQRETMRREAYRRAQVRSMAISGTSGSTSVSTPVWSPLGPAPMNSIAVAGEVGDYGLVTGRATTVVVDQNDPTGNTVYVGGAYGGLWKSTTAANTDITKVFWTPLIDDQATIAVGSMAIQPGNPNLLIVGTGEAHSSADSYYGLGILRSEDGGNSWTLIDSADSGAHEFHGLAFAKIAFSTDNPNIVVAAAASASQGITVGAEASNYQATRGIYYSQDSGKTWSLASFSDGNGLTPDAGSVSSVIYNPQQGLFYAAFRYHGFYVSSDGTTWKRMGTEGLGFTQPPAGLSLSSCPSAFVSTCPIYRGEITQVPGRDEMYVIIVDRYDNNKGIYRTLDGGKNWNSISTSGMVNCGDSDGCNTKQGTYNLAITAVPNNTSTDLFVGAVNVFRCNIPSGSSSCSFANLTHVYGCDIAKVHPDEHSFDYSLTHPEIMYFANDGGIYRTLTSRTMIPAASCGGGNVTLSFDNLNGTMGSMTQFVWFSQHPTTATTLLGGTQDNGSPMIDASYSGTSGVLWRSVQSGDGGYNDINPDNPSERFASYPAPTTHVLVARCTSGDTCTNNLFSNNIVVRSSTLGGDTSAFYMPYMLDPQDSGKLIMGTCRVWRSTTLGGNAVALSQTFDGTTTCVADPNRIVPFVSAIAAGGANIGGSQVLYAGTVDGRVYFTNQGTISSNWTRISNNGAFWNPSVCGSTDSPVPCPISGIAIDPRDTTGLTAYVTVMGFKTPHVWQTADGGQSWTNITGNLPDSPADGVVVYKADGTIYVGTDVGVYSTTTLAGSSTVWTEVGPATGTGTLPNVAITRLAIFAPPSAPARLRVSTYGRGVWEIPLAGSAAPDFTIAISDPDQVVFSGQTATYHGTISYLNGYSSAIAISCDATTNGTPGPLPQTCEGSAVTNGSFTVTATNTFEKDFSFRIKAVGSDPNSLTRQVPVSVRFVNYTIGTPQPSSVTNVVHGSSTTVQVPVTSLGSFNAPVTIGCLGQPVDWTCSSAAVTPQPGGTITATVTINTVQSTPEGNYSFYLSATSAGQTIPKYQVESVGVVQKPDFIIGSASFGNSPAKITQTLFGNFTITPIDGYTGTVTLSCSGAAGLNIPASSCVFSNGLGAPPTTSITLGANPVTVIFSFPTTSATAGNADMTFQVTDGTITKTVTLPFSITDYSLGNFTVPANVAPGGSTSFNFQLTPLNGYTGSVALTCDTSTLPVNATCTLNPASPISLTPGTTTTVLASVSVPQGETAGTYPITIKTADQGTPSLTHDKSTNLQVLQSPDFTLNASVATDTVIRGGTSNMTLQATGQNAASTVNYSISGCPQNATCMMSPPTSQTIVGTAVTSTLSVATQTSTPVGLYTITVTGTSSTATHTATFTLHLVDYAIDFGTTSSATLKAGQSTTAPINFVANTGDATFNAQVTFTIAGCPARTTCSVSPNPFNPSNANPANPSLNIATTASSTSSLQRSNGGTAFAFWLSLPFGVFGIVVLRRHRAAAGMLVVTCALLLGLAACGGGGGGSTTPPPTFNQGTPSGTYTITVTGTAGTTVKTANFTLTVQ